MSKFPYKYDVDKYIEVAFDKMKELYPWVTKEMFNNCYRYSIEKINGRYKYIKYINNEKRILDLDAEGFIDEIINDNSSYIEYANPVKEEFIIDYDGEINLSGWSLEIYSFRRHELGGYSLYVQAGNRSTGGSRTFFINPKYMKYTFEEFLDSFFDEMNLSSFGIGKNYLKNVNGLKEFLGFEK